MIVIADSTTFRTHWAIVDQGKIVERATTAGINPYFQTRREISHVIRLELPETFFAKRFEKVFFYGAGCANKDKNKQVESSVIAQFRSPAEISSDLIGGARGLLVHSPGIACIISTGSNSCYYDGYKVVKNVRPGGYILGDEGSLGHMGRLLLSDVLKEIAPTHIIEGFYDNFHTTPDEVLDLVYSHPNVSTTISHYALYLVNVLDTEYAYELVYGALLEFFKRNIAYYDYKTFPLSIKINRKFPFTPILTKVAYDFGAVIAKYETSIMEGLVKYHCGD